MLSFLLYLVVLVVCYLTPKLCFIITRIVHLIIFNLSQVDLVEIKTEFKNKTGRTLKTAIEDEMKGDLEKLLLMIVGD